MSTATNTPPRKSHRKDQKRNKGAEPPTSDDFTAAPGQTIPYTTQNNGQYQLNGQYPVFNNMSTSSSFPIDGQTGPEPPLIPGARDQRRPRQPETSTQTNPTSTTKKKKPRQRQAPKEANDAAGLASPPSSGARAINGTPHNQSKKSPARSPATKTPPIQAYAGPTFHASPAASSLPIPKFFAKTIAEKSAENVITSTAEEDSSDSTPDSPTAAIQAVQSGPARNESPLEFFFRADREEKAKATRNSQNTTPAVASKSASSTRYENQSFFPFESQDHHESKLDSQQSTGRPTSGVFAFELSPRPSPNAMATKSAVAQSKERINTTRADSAPTVPFSTDKDEARRQAGTQALKAILSKSSQRPSTSSGSYRTPQAYEVEGSSAAGSLGSNRSNPLSRQSMPAQQSMSQFSGQPSAFSPPQSESRNAHRHSGLRQETQSYNPNTGSRRTSHQPHSRPGNTTSTDATAIARKYLDEQLAASRPKSSPFDQNQGFAPAEMFSGVVNPKASENNQSVKLMEDNLRRLLNVGTGSQADQNNK